MNTENINFYQQATYDDPTNQENYWRLGLAYLLTNQIDDAFDVWISTLLKSDSLINENPTELLVKFLQVEFYEQLKIEDIENTKIIYDAILEIDDENNIDVKNVKNKFDAKANEKNVSYKSFF